MGWWSPIEAPKGAALRSTRSRSVPLATPIAPGLWCDGRSVGPQGYGELPVSESGSCQGPWLRSVSALGIEAIAGLGAIGSGRCPAGTGVDLRLYPMGQTTPCSLAWSAMVSPQALARSEEHTSELQSLRHL